MTIRNGRRNDFTLITTHRQPAVDPNDFHTFGCYWKNNNKIQVYLDGRPVRTFKPSIANAYRLPMRIEMVLETNDHNPASGWPRGNYLDADFKNRIIQSFVSGSRDPNTSDGKRGSFCRACGNRRDFSVRSAQYDDVRVWRKPASSRGPQGILASLWAGGWLPSAHCVLNPQKPVKGPGTLMPRCRNHAIISRPSGVTNRPAAGTNTVRATPRPGGVRRGLFSPRSLARAPFLLKRPRNS